MNAMRAGWNHFWKGIVTLYPDFVLWQKEKSHFSMFLCSAGEKSLFTDFCQRLSQSGPSGNFSLERELENRSLEHEEFVCFLCGPGCFFFFFRGVKTLFSRRRVHL